MKRSVVMKSLDRSLFGTIVKQETKDEFLSLSDLTYSYSKARFVYGWKEKRLNDILESKDTKERVYYLLIERGSIKAEISAFMEMCQNEGLVKVLKGLGLWRTKGRGGNRSVFCDQYIWTLIAMELNPMIYAKVVIWLTDSLIFNRVYAGTEYLPMNRSIKSIIPTPNYPEYARLINMRVFGRHEKGIRDIATEGQLKLLVEIECFITRAIEMGMCTSETQLILIIRNFK